MPVATAEKTDGPVKALETRAKIQEAAAARRIEELEAALARAQAEVDKFDGNKAEMFPPEIFAERALKLPKAGFEEQDFLRLISFLMGLEEDVRFWIGDALNQGEAIFGEAVWQALSTKWSYRTISEYRRVCARLPRKLRLRNVDWAHFKYVADVTDADGAPDREEQKRILRLARDNADWTTRMTEAECNRVKARLRGMPEPGGQEVEPDSTATGVVDPLTEMVQWKLTVHALNRHAEVEELMARHEQEIRDELKELGVTRSEVSMTRRNPTA